MSLFNLSKNTVLTIDNMRHSVFISLAVFLSFTTAQANESLFSHPSEGFMTRGQAQAYCASFQLSLPSKAQFIALATERGARYSNGELVDTSQYRPPSQENLLGLFWSNEPTDGYEQVLVFSGQAGFTQTRNQGESRAAAICYGTATTNGSPFASYLQRYNRANLVGFSGISSRRLGYIFKLVVDDSGARLESVCSESMDRILPDGLSETAHPSANTSIASPTDLNNLLSMIPRGMRDYISQAATNLGATNATLGASNGKLVSSLELIVADGQETKDIMPHIQETCGYDLRYLSLNGSEYDDVVFIVSEIAQADAVNLALTNGEFPTSLRDIEESGWKIANVAGGRLSITRNDESSPLSLGYDFMRIKRAVQETYLIPNPPWRLTIARPTTEERSQIQQIVQRH